MTKQREYAGYVLKSSAALLAIINDILDLATIDTRCHGTCSSAMSISQRRCAPRPKACRIGWRNRRSTCRSSPSTSIGVFRADAKRIRQILFNLLSNAIGFSEPGQTVTLAALRRDDEIVFKVSDKGGAFRPT